MMKIVSDSKEADIIEIKHNFDHDDDVIAIEKEVVVRDDIDQTIPQHRRRKAKKLYCAKCPYRTMNITYFKKHLNIHDETRKIGRYKCKFCYFHSERIMTLKNHEKIHEIKSIKIENE